MASASEQKSRCKAPVRVVFLANPRWTVNFLPWSGANKRDAGVTSPLDLSSPGGFAPRKRQRAETRRSGSVSPKPKTTPRPTTPPPVRCPSLCGHMPCGDGQAVNRWTIEDVVNYVSSIDSCAEYAQVSHNYFSFLNIFRETDLVHDDCHTFVAVPRDFLHFVRNDVNFGEIFRPL